MRVSLEDLDAFPTFLPVEQLDGHVIRGGEDEGLGRMYGNGSDVVGVGLEGGDFLGGVVVVHTQLKVVRATDDPVLPGDEAASSDGDVRQLESLDYLLGLIAPDIDMTFVGSQGPVLAEEIFLPASTGLDDVKKGMHTAVESCEDPWLMRVEVDALGGAVSIKAHITRKEGAI